jgi:fructan beta-fructosidase
MTLPRELKLQKVDTSYYVAAEPVKELAGLAGQPMALQNMTIKGRVDLTSKFKTLAGQYKLKLNSDELKSFSIILSNQAGEQLLIGYDRKDSSWFIDRTRAGISDFNKDFAGRIATRRISPAKNTDLTLIVDAASVELFADQGLNVMTAIVFPHQPYNRITISSAENLGVSSLVYTPLKGIWR